VRNRRRLGTDSSALGETPSSGGGAGGAPTSASYVTLGTDGDLTNERVLTAGSGISVTDGGAGSTVTIAATSSGLTASQAAAIASMGV
jgi:hypothetical protein